MNYAYSLLLLFSLASYLINGMDPSDFVWGIESERIVCEWQPKWSYQCSFKSRKIGELHEKWDGFRGDEKKDTSHLKVALKPYLDGKESTISHTIIKELKRQDNISLFSSCKDYLEKKNNTDFVPLMSLMPILFDSQVKSKDYQYLMAACKSSPEIFNKALFGLRIPVPTSKDIHFSSERIKGLWHVSASEKNKLSIFDKGEWYLIDQQFFYHLYTSYQSMRSMTKKEKECYWQESFSPKFHAEFCDQEAVKRYRAQVTYILLINNRLKKAKGSGIDKRVLYPQIIVPLFEQEFTDFKNHCNTVEIELGKEVGLTDIEDPEQKPFFESFPQWYVQEKKACFESLERFETVQKILSYKFGK